MPPRRKLDALRDLDTVERTIRSNRKSALTTANRRTADIADAVLPSLERKRARLMEEAELLPDNPSRADAYSKLTHYAGPPGRSLTEAEEAQLDKDGGVPLFLRRKAAVNKSDDGT